MLSRKKETIHLPKTTRRVFLDWLEAIAITFVIAFGIVRPFVFELYKVPTGSMETTINVGDRIFVDKMSYLWSSVERGDIAVFKFGIVPSQNYVKRIVGIPGDTIAVKDKVLYINGVPQQEDYITISTFGTSFTSYRDNMPEFTIPENKYFAMGDNRENSFDSRYWGFVDADSIKGKARFVIWSKVPNGGIKFNRIFHPLN